MATFLKSLKNGGYLDDLSMTIAQVGSRKLSEKDDYGSQEWHVFAPNLKIYGFDADVDACEAANADLEARGIDWFEQHIPLTLSDRVGEATLYVTKDPMCSSLYRPNVNYLGRFAELAGAMDLDFSIEVETTTLDEFFLSTKASEVDFLHIDVQGADLNVLQGATGLLSRSGLGILIEVCFAPLYLNQPLFADVDNYLRDRNFTLFHFWIKQCARKISPIYSIHRPGQLTYGDALYFRDLLEDRNVDLQKNERLLKLACIADIFDFIDYSLEILTFLTIANDGNSKYNFAQIIINTLVQVKGIEDSLDSLPLFKQLQKYL